MYLVIVFIYQHWIMSFVFATKITGKENQPVDQVVVTILLWLISTVINFDSSVDFESKLVAGVWT